MKTYQEIADANGLDEDTGKRYIQYMRSRWAKSEKQKCADGYAAEWAIRFKQGREYEASDAEGKAILLKQVGG